jgi:hypothetical protein
MQDQEQLLTAGDVARETGLSRQRVNKLATDGRIGRQIAGRYWVFTREETDRLKLVAKTSKGGRPKDNPTRIMENRTPALAAG